MKKYLLLLLSFAVVACHANPQDSQKERAKAVFDQAVAIYQQKDYAQALPLFAKASEMGHIKANRYIGLSYLNGEGVEKDGAKAFEQFNFAAERGDTTSKYWLGYLYENGIGTTKSLEKAIYWYRQGAERSDHVGEPARAALKRLGVL
ncbi:tetratricopeptide repeat protein [Bisgaard Taxon 10/6]|uniref:tetratricopeptide repeat protein n=1 Tax=Exercitatus varius TaxID=67857 RepID=UPI00294B1EEF|nr:tetratricopeptide repeat protein [Exercitatus varius]MDG2953792.1 tetratricopeptide repeat protein [Exercitatus varius]